MPTSLGHHDLFKLFTDCSPERPSRGTAVGGGGGWMNQRPRAHQGPRNMPGILHIYRVRGVAELFEVSQRSSHSNRSWQLVLPRVLCFPLQAPRSRNAQTAHVFVTLPPTIEERTACSSRKSVLDNGSGKHFFFFLKHRFIIICLEGCLKTKPNKKKSVSARAKGIFTLPKI